jgi:RNA polymerase sigma factor (sigma-70 family)
LSESKNPCEIDSPEGLTLLKKKDGEAWKMLLRCYAKQLRRDILVSLINANLSSLSISDIEQETWATAARKMDEFSWQGPNLLYHWLRAISYRKIQNQNRLSRRNHEIFSLEQLRSLNPDDRSDIDWFYQRTLFFSESAEDEVIKREEEISSDMQSSTQEKVETRYRNLLRDESPHHVELFIQRVVYGKPPRALASFFGMKPSTVRQIIYRLKQKLVLLETQSSQSS